MKIYFPIHLDGGNRGCEAIAKGTAVILGKPREDLVGLCSNLELDKRLGTNKFVSLWQSPLWLKVCSKFYYKLKSFFMKDESELTQLYFECHYNMFLSKMESEDILFSTGGDMLCYGNNEVIYTNEKVRARGLKSVLWGCSIGRKDLTPEKIETLKHFSLIYARESLTATMLKQELNLKNIVTFPDPAFVLEPEKVELPDCFDIGEVVGINLSNYVLGGFDFHSSLGKDVIALIDAIINLSNRHILLIPHVMWNNQDDRIVSRIIYDKYKNTRRVHLLDSDSLNYCQLRYVISKCFIFIGARTHAMISAYSTCVPSVALGYSIKSVGIATDLSMPVDTVVDSKQYNPGALEKAYNYVEENVTEIRRELEMIIPEYKKSAYELREIINRL